MALFRENLFYSLFYMLFGFLIVMSFQTLVLAVLIMFGITLEHVLNHQWITAIVESVCLLLIIALAWFNVFKKLRQKLNKLIPYFVSFILNIFIFMQLGRLTTNWIVNGKSINYVYMYTLFIAVIVLNALLINYVIRAQREIDQIKSYNEYEKMIIPLIENSRGAEHDFKNHLLTLKSLSKNSGVEFSSYIDEINEDIKNNSVYKLCTNPVMGALLQEKNGFAIANDIGFEIEVIESDAQPKSIKPHHLIALLSNLIDNAFEESEKSHDKKVKMKYIQRDDISISVVNSLAGKKDINDMRSAKRYSTKGKNRGYGLGNIKKIAKLYNGDVSIYHLGENIEIKVKLNP